MLFSGYQTFIPEGHRRFINKTLESVRKITGRPILMRLDSGMTARKTSPIRRIYTLIIKRHLRWESVQGWVDLAQQIDQQQICPQDKHVWSGCVFRRTA